MKTEAERRLSEALELVNRAWLLLMNNKITDDFCNTDWYNMRTAVSNYKDFLLRLSKEVKE